MLRNPLAVILGTLLLVPAPVYADKPGALWLTPSQKWYGIDGNWSSTGLFVGDPAQEIDVTVSTSLSEIWVVETSGCGTSSLCTAARGGTYNTSASHSWSPLGPWQLGLGYLDNDGNGDYAMETVAVHDDVRQSQVPLSKQVVAGINETAYYTGFLGLGITPGKFQNVVVQSPISTLVEQAGVIPSHSYGYTAGAWYGGSSGTPLSLTLGGYDANRFEPHDIKFSLDPSTRQPNTLVRAITASVSDVAKAPTTWASPSVSLMGFNESVTALIDSSTPYLWLPSTVCDRFAASFNLTWDESFGLYLFTGNENLDRYRSSPDLSFTFTLSSTDNHDNFGQPLDVPGVVNITISAQAFIQSLRYPFKNLIPYRSPAVPYFPLKRADNTSQIIIGRSFLQEAYMITNYETSTFSVHQARFPDDPWVDTSIQTIAFTPNSGYAGPAKKTGGQGGLTQSQLVGLIVGISVVGIVAIAAILLVLKRRQRQGHLEAAQSDDKLKDGFSTPEPETPKSPVVQMLSRMTKNCPWRKAKKRGGDGYEAFEVGADRSHERFEMPVQAKPVELEATNTMSSIGVTDFASKPAHRRSAYEMEKLQLEIAMQGLVVPHYAPLEGEPAKGPPYQNPSPASSPTQGTYSDRPPSPVSPQSDWTNYVPDFPSSVGLVPARTRSRSSSDPHLSATMHAPPSPRSIDQVTLARSASSGGSTPSSPAMPMPMPLPLPPAFQRTPIDPARVVCLGPMPDYVQLPQWPSPPRARAVAAAGAADGNRMQSSVRHSRCLSAADTLGSDFTIEEEAREAAARTLGRMRGFDDMVHVPQPAQRRYSWEEEDKEENS